MRRSVLTFALAAAMSSAAGAAITGQPQSLPLGDFGGRLRSIELTVNGQKGLFTIDTGGGVSLVSPDFAKKIGCAPWGAHTGFRLTGERLDLPRCDGITFSLPNGEKLKRVSAGVVDLQPLLFKGAPHVDGSIALDAFEGRIFTLDLGNGSLTMLKSAPTAMLKNRASQVPIRLARQAGGAALGVMVPVATPRGDAWMALDSGGGPPVLVRDNVAPVVGLKAKADGLQPYSLNLRGSRPISVQTRAIVRDMILDGVIGMPVLVQWKLTFDLNANKLWMQPSR